jgi:hypothetical protein
MSGSTGGNRILREDIFLTMINYKRHVLELYQKFEYCTITGSYNYSTKKDFGDIDLIVQLDGYDKKESKKKFISFLKRFRDDIIVPFISEKYKGKKYLNTGEIITILYPIIDSKGYVQIDNIISLSSEETDFKNHFLSLPAIKQGLMLGLIKTTLLENPYFLESIENKPLILKPNQELEFNLSSAFLTLRLVDITPEYKITKRVDIWKTTEWKIVEKLISNYDFDKNFEEILKDIKNKLHNPRSINRIKGIFKSMVSVKSGEKNTEKGNEKEYALNLMKEL